MVVIEGAASGTCHLGLHPGPPLGSCVTLGSSLYLSVPLCPGLRSGADPPGRLWDECDQA